MAKLVAWVANLVELAAVSNGRLPIVSLAANAHSEERACQGRMQCAGKRALRLEMRTAGAVAHRVFLSLHDHMFCRSMTLDISAN